MTITISTRELASIYEERDYYKNLLESKKFLNQKLCDALGIDHDIEPSVAVQKAIDIIHKLKAKL